MQVKVKHVKEAFRLLNKSIIRVEQPDINLQEENEEEEMEIDEPPTEIDNNGDLLNLNVIYFFEC